MKGQQKLTIISFLHDLMKVRKRLPSQLAADLGVSHAAVSRWLSGKDKPGMQSCRRLAEYSGKPLQELLSAIGYLPNLITQETANWPEFREYARRKYSAELDEDLIIMISNLIENRRARRAKRREEKRPKL